MRIGSAARIALAVVFLSATRSDAAVFVVDTTEDAFDVTPGDGLCASESGACTLRAAVLETSALPGADRIVVPPGTYALTRIGNGEDDRGYNGDLDIFGDLVISGAGRSATILDGGHTFRVVHVPVPRRHDPVGRVSIRNLTIQNGYSEFGGGVRHDAGFLSLRNVVVRSCATPSGLLFGGAGGGIYVEGRLSLVRSLIEGNVSSFGGGISIGLPYFDLRIPPTVIRDSTIVGNTTEPDDLFGSGGGGIAGVGQVHLVMRNVTISGNSTSGVGGGLLIGSNCGNGFSESPCKNRNRYVLNNVTISSNTGTTVIGGFPPLERTTGGGLWVSPVGDDPLRVELSNTIIAGNSPTDCSASFPDHPLTSRGHNLIGNTFDCPIETIPTLDLIGADPGLLPLADNGGPTPTHALAADSPALDAGSPLAVGSGEPACEANDQRGLPRTNGACDIGAFEAVPD